MGNRSLEHSSSIETKIIEALGKPIGCVVARRNNTYTIKPQYGQKELQINAFHDTVDIYGDTFYLLKTCNLVFEYCVFVCEISLQVELNIEAIPIDNKISFKNCTFQKTISFSYVTFNKSVIFEYAIFEDIAYFTEARFKSRIYFIGCKFKNEVNLSKSIFSDVFDIHNSTFQYIDMKQAIFEKEAKFSNCKFQTEADFSISTFSQEVDFKQAIFKASAYFDHATFSGNADFKRSEFCENAHFYQTNFSENPDFSQAMFNERLNLTDAKIHNENSNPTDTPIFNFDFEVLKKEVQTCSKADEYRDIFKNIKNALIKSGNLLGASRFRKMELYCKEIELDLKKKENREFSTRDFIDRIQLYCYRVTSDHHTDLLLILNNVIFLIALFGVINFCLAIYTSNISFGGIVAKINDTKNIAIVFSSLIFVLFSIYFIFGYCKIANSEFRNSTLTMAILLVVFCFFIPDFALILTGAYCIIACLFVILLFVVLLCHFSQKSKCIKKTIFILSYLNVLVMAFVSPSSILPVLGKLLEDKSSETCFSVFENMNIICSIDISTSLATLNLIYMLLLFLLLFSLQKTARKNTIVPN